MSILNLSRCLWWPRPCCCSHPDGPLSLFPLNELRPLFSGIAARGRNATLGGQMLHRHAEHDQRPAIEDQADADEQADHPQSRHRPSLPNHDPKSEGDDPVKNRPSPVWSTNAYRRNDPKETLEDQEKGDQQREDDGGRPRIGEDQESSHDVENTGQQVEEKAAPAPLLRAGMDSTNGTGKDHQPAENSHREDRHHNSLTDCDPSHEYEEDSEQQKPPPVILDLIQSGKRNYVSVH